MKAGRIIAGLAGAIVIGHAPAIISEAHADVSAACWAHLGDVTTSNSSPAADRRYHLEHGEPSPCTEYDATQSNENEQAKPANEKKHEDRHCIGRCNDKWWRND